MSSRAASNQATVTLALENNGTFDAYGVQATMYSPDDTTTVNDNIVGGNGRVRPGRHVAVGSVIEPPDLVNWSSSTAKPYATGDYTGPADRTFTFTVASARHGRPGSTAMTWTDDTGGSGTLDLGSSYHAPLPRDVRDGLQIGFDTGALAAGNSFTVKALSPRDTLRYTINTDPNNPASYRPVDRGELQRSAGQHPVRDAGQTHHAGPRPCAVQRADARSRSSSPSAPMPRSRLPARTRRRFCSTTLMRRRSWARSYSLDFITDGARCCTSPTRWMCSRAEPGGRGLEHEPVRAALRPGQGATS